MPNPKILQTLFRFSFAASVLAISYIAFLPNYDDLPEFTSLSDILNHFAAFFVLSFFLERGFSARAGLAFLLLFAYGLFIEVVQHFLPNRCFDLLDLLIDMAGVLVYYALLRAIVLIKGSEF